MIFALIWRNLWRNKRRSLITMASVFFAVMLAILFKSLQVGVFDNLIKNVVSFYSGYIQVHKKGYKDEQVLDNAFILNPALTDSIRNNRHVTVISPRIESYALASGSRSTKGCLVLGINPDREETLTGLRTKIISGTCFREHENSALIGKELAARLGLGVNDTLYLIGQGYRGASAAGRYVVRGLLKFGSPTLDESMVYLPLLTARDFLNADSVATTLAIGIDDPGNLNLISNQLKKSAGTEYEVITWEEFMPEISNHIKADSTFFYLWIGILYMVVAFGIFGTMLMMMAERRYELGMLVAIGMKKIRIGWMLLGESVLIAFFGILAGMAVSLPLVIYLHRQPIRFTGEMATMYENFGFEPVWPTTVAPGIFMTQGIIVLCLALLAGIYPLLSVLRMDPVTSMKK